MTQVEDVKREYASDTIAVDPMGNFTPLKDLPLTGLFLAGTPVRDLELLNGMPLKNLSIQNTGVTDPRPLRGMELEEIYLTPKNITQGLEILRDMAGL